MGIQKSLSLLLCIFILFRMIPGSADNTSKDFVAADSDNEESRLLCSDISHLLNNYYSELDLEVEPDPLEEARIKSEYEAKIQKEAAETILKDSHILDYIEADDFYSTVPLHRLTDAEALNTYVFQNADGSNTTYYLSENIKYLTEDGTIREKDIRLIPEKESYSVYASDTKINISSNVAKGTELDTVLGKIKIFVDPTGRLSASCNTSFLADRNSVMYNNAFGEGAHLRCTPLLSGIKEDILLEKEQESNCFSFYVETDNLIPVYKDGILCLKSHTNDGYYLSFGQIYVFDKNGRFTEGTIYISETTDTGSYVINITVPENFMNDPEIIYPVTVDPQIEIKAENNSSNIIDAAVYQNQPNMNAGSWSYNNIGYTDSTYGLARTVFKLSGLLNDSTYQALSGWQISAASFTVREATGNSSKTVKIHPMTGNPSWTESTITWNNCGSFDTSVNYGGSIGNDEPTTFIITNLVKAWKNGSYNGNGCFIFIMGGTENSESRALYSSEYTTGSYRPYLSITYQNPYLMLLNNDITVESGGTVYNYAFTNLTNGTVTWSVNQQAIATASVSPESSNICTINGVAPGKTLILVVLYNGGTPIASSFCYVTVTLPDGVYTIKNSSNYYIKTNGNINNGTMVFQGTLTESFDPLLPLQAYQQARDMWKIKYLGSDRYSIRSLTKPDMGLNRTSTNNVTITNISVADSLSDIESNNRWGIAWDATINGLKIYSDASNSLVIQGNNNLLSSGVSIVVSSINTINCKWIFNKIDNPPEGVEFYNLQTGAHLTEPVVTILKGNSTSIIANNILAVVFGASSNSQTVIWGSENTNISEINPYDGTIVTKISGQVNLTASVPQSYPNLSCSIRLDVIPFANGYYYIQNVDSNLYIKKTTPSNNSNLTLDYYSHGDAEEWKLEYWGDFYYTIRSSVNTQYYIGVKNDSSSNNADVVTRNDLSISDGMKWKIEDNGNGFYTITPKCAEAVNRHMNESFTNIKLSSTSSESSKWSFFNAGDILNNFELSCWYSNEDEIWYWEEQVLVGKDNRYQGLAHDFDYAIQYAITNWNSNLAITISSTNQNDANVLFIVASRSELISLYPAVEQYFSASPLGVAPLETATISFVGFAECNNAFKSVCSTSGAIIFLVTDPEDQNNTGIPFNENGTAAHELGHALGFRGHIPGSFNGNCIMKQGDYINQSFSVLDFDHLQQMYVQDE